MASLRLENITKRFASLKTDTIPNLSLSIKDGEFVVFVGPSGCGKSTLLRMIAGLEEVTQGSVFINDRDITDMLPSRRNMAMVFQSYALYPHMNVRDNMAFALKLAKIPVTEINTRVANVASMLGLTDFLERKPKHLSGGQRQRVAIGRAIVREPQLFLFDEPLSNLDATLRVQTRVELSLLHKQLKTTMIYVTHDQVEAMTLAQRIVVINGGVIEQVGTPDEIYKNPNNIFVAGFIGAPKMSFLQTTVKAVNAQTLTLTLKNGKDLQIPKNITQAPIKILPHDALTLGIRPEDISIKQDATKKPSALNAKIELIENLGSDTFLHVRLNSEMIRVRIHDNKMKDIFTMGEDIMVVPNPEKIHLFNSEGANIFKDNSKSSS